MPDKDQQGIKPQDAKAPATLENGRKPGLFNKSRDFLQSAVDSITGKELPRLVEEFTREMVVVAEGLSEDQEALRNTQVLQGAEQDKLSQRLRDMDKQLKEMSARLDDLTRKDEKRRKAEGGLHRILRQATVLAAILAGAWVIVTLVNAFVR